MQLNIEFPRSDFIAPTPRSFHKPQPLFVTADGVSGRLQFIPSTVDLTLPETIVQIQVVGED